MPKVTEEHWQARREQILEAALNCFARSGFHRTSMRDICKEAGLSAGAVYLHFSGKEDIIDETWRRVREVRAARFKVTEPDDLMQSLQEFWKDYGRRLAKTNTDRIWQLGVQLLSEAIWNPRIGKSLRENWDDAEKNFAKAMRRVADQGLTRPDIDYDALARLLQVLREGLVIMRVLDPERDLQKCFAILDALLADYIRIGPDNADERRSDGGWE